MATSKMMDTQLTDKLLQRIKEPLLEVSAPQSKSSFETLKTNAYENGVLVVCFGLFLGRKVPCLKSKKIVMVFSKFCYCFRCCCCFFNVSENSKKLSQAERICHQNFLDSADILLRLKIFLQCNISSRFLRLPHTFIDTGLPRTYQYTRNKSDLSYHMAWQQTQWFQLSSMLASVTLKNITEKK